MHEFGESYNLESIRDLNAMSTTLATTHMGCEPSYSTKDHWISTRIYKRILNSGMFWTVTAAEKKKSKLT